MSQVSGLSQSASQWIRSNRIKLSKLPKPNVDFKSTEIELSAQTLLTAKNHGVVKVPKRILDPETGSYRNIWQTTHKGHDAIQNWNEANEDKSGFLPCGHDAFRNLGDSLECKREGCNQIHDKEDL